jgi:phosphate transport system substrate-binding protein
MVCRHGCWLLLLSVACLQVQAVSAQVVVDPKLTSYAPKQGISGSVKSVGSDTMNNLMTLWGEGFKKYYPNVKLEVEGKGSSTAPPALIEGTADFGPMSRDMKQKEIDNFESKFGYKPTALPAAIDMLAVFVHKDNPINRLTLAEVDAIFSKTRKLGHSKDVVKWGDVGLTGDWADKPISLYGRNAASGTYGYFKERALGNGDYKPGVKEQPGSSSVVQGVASDKYGIGYSGMGYLTADVRAVALARKPADKKGIPPLAQFAYSGEYPLSRFLNVYVNYKPGGKLDPVKREMVRYIFSREGQSDVLKDGYLPVVSRISERALKSVGLSTTP